MTNVDLRYPIGRPAQGGPVTSADRAIWIAQIEELPARLEATLAEVQVGALDRAYRVGGWSIRQVVHHLADSHLNAYIRFKLALTEENPTIKPYDEARWAELPDVSATPPDISVALLRALHRRWTELLRHLPEAAFERTVHHPDRDRKMSLNELIRIYAWHGDHHLAHIRIAGARVDIHPEPEPGEPLA